MVGRTDIGPMIERIVSSAGRMRRMQDVFAVSINAGFASADVAKGLAQQCWLPVREILQAHAAFAETIADDIWNRRFEVLNDYLGVFETAAAFAAAYKPRERTVGHCRLCG